MSWAVLTLKCQKRRVVDEYVHAKRMIMMACRVSLNKQQPVWLLSSA